MIKVDLVFLIEGNDALFTSKERNLYKTLSINTNYVVYQMSIYFRINI